MKIPHGSHSTYRHDFRLMLFVFAVCIYFTPHLIAQPLYKGKMQYARLDGQIDLMNELNKKTRTHIDTFPPLLDKEIEIWMELSKDTSGGPDSCSFFPTYYFSGKFPFPLIKDSCYFYEAGETSSVDWTYRYFYIDVRDTGANSFVVWVRSIYVYHVLIQHQGYVPKFDLYIGKMTMQKNSALVSAVNEDTRMIFPNPAHETLRIKSQTVTQYKIFSTDGIEQPTTKEVLSGGDTIIDVSALVPGIYFIVTDDSKNTQSLKFCKY